MEVQNPTQPQVSCLSARRSIVRRNQGELFKTPATRYQAPMEYRASSTGCSPVQLQPQESHVRPRSAPLAVVASALAGTLLLLAVMGPGQASAHDLLPKPTFPELSEKDEARLVQGKLVLRTTHSGDEGAGVITGIIEIEASYDRIWKHLINFESIPESSPAVKEASRYLDKPGAQGSQIVDTRYLLKVGWISVVYNVHHDLFPDKYYLVWTLDPTRANDIVKTDGSFSLWPGSSPGKVRFLYNTSVDTGRNIPDWIEEELTESSLKRFILYVKKNSER